MKIHNIQILIKSLIVLIMLLSSYPVMGVTNLLINDMENAAISIHSTFIVAFDYENNDSLAHAKIWIDVNMNGVIDSLTDIYAFDTYEEDDPLIDGDSLDLDMTKNGTFSTEVTDFFPAADVTFLFEIMDSGGADTATLTVEHLDSDFSISGKILEPADQPHLIVEAYMYDTTYTDTVYSPHSTVNKLRKTGRLPQILSTYEDEPEYDKKSYGTLTDENGEYTIFVPDSSWWMVYTHDEFDLIPEYMSPMTEMVYVNEHEDSINFKYIVPDVVVTGKVTDHLGMPLIDEFEEMLDFMVYAIDSYDDNWEVAEVDSIHYKLFLMEGSYRISVADVLPQYVAPYPVELDVVSGESYSDIDFVCYPVDDYISGTVTKFENDSLSDIRIIGKDSGESIGRTYTMSDSSGHYMLPVSSEAGEWYLSLDKEYLPYRTMVEDGNLRIAGPGDQDINFNLIELRPAPEIREVHDIPQDQGRQVGVIWNASPLDEKDNYDEHISQYSLWRLHPLDRTNNNQKKQMTEKSNNKFTINDYLAAVPLINENDRYEFENERFLWEFIATVPAIYLPVYSYVTPTLGDSTENGIHWSYFVTVAHTKYSESFYISNIDSGYSIDNLSPPKPIVMAEGSSGEILLKWDPDSAPDVIAYHIFRGTMTGFTPSQETKIGITPEAEFKDINISDNQVYYYRVAAVDDAFNRTMSDEIIASTTDVSLISTNIPETYKLASNFPNPFNPVTQIHYQIPENGHVTLSIYNILGEKVKTVIDQYQMAGYYKVNWNAHNDAGDKLSSGVYIYELKVNDFNDSRKMILTR